MSAVQQGDQYDFWRRRLTGEVIPIHEGEAQSGFYRVRSRDKTTWRTVAYWFKDGALRCRVNGDDIDEQRAMELWPFASKNPITHEVYRAVSQGGAWPDLHEAVTADRINSSNAPADNSLEALQDRIADLARDAEKLIADGAARSQEAADRASDLANRLGELHKQADTARAAEKKPHDDAAKAVQAKWLPVLSLAEVYKRLKNVVVGPFLVEQDRKRREAEQAALKAAEEAAKAGREPPPPAAASAPVKAGSGGRRSVALRTQKRAVIVDHAAALSHFANHSEVKALVETLANRAVRGGFDVPGVKVTEEQVAA
jgi:hypothetical protein